MEGQMHGDEKEKLIKKGLPGKDYQSVASNIQDSGLKIETAQSYKARWRTMKVLYITMFFSSVEFAIVMSSLWPYLQKVNPKVSATFLGWTNAGFSLCQMVGSFALGLWCHRFPAVQPLLFSMFLLAMGSLLYGYGEAFGTNGPDMILAARMFLGLSAGNVVVCRTVVSQSTTLAERTNAFANLAIVQALGFAFGPALQAAVVPLGNKGLYYAPLKLTLDVYTAPGFLGFLMAIVNFVAIVVWFKEIKVDIYAGQKNINVNMDELPKPDYRAIAVSTIVYFVLLTVFALNETIITPLVMDEFAWTDTKAVLYGGILLAVAGVIAVFCFQFVKPATKRFGERAVLSFGLVVTLVGFIVYLPWGDKYPVLQISKIISKGNHTVTEITPGCPMKYKWCQTTPKLYFPQFLTSATLVGVGYPVGFLVISTIYSKILGPRQQGAYMAWISAIGSFARVIGPLMASNAYVDIGPRWTFLAVDILLTFTILVTGCFYDRLVPFHEYLERRRLVPVV